MKKIKWLSKRLLFVVLLQSITALFYINFYFVNIYSKEKTFYNKSHEVTLLGISHIGTDEYYSEIKERYLGKENFLVLLEGVKIESEVEDSDLDHSYTAKIFDLKSQPKDLFKKYAHINADIYYEEINDEVSLYLDHVFEFWKHLSFLDYKKAKSQLELLSELNTDPDLIKSEIIGKRNKSIISSIEKHKNKNLLVPWGALHQSDIEDYLKSKGYKEKETSYIKNFNVFKVLYSISIYFIKG